MDEMLFNIKEAAEGWLDVASDRIVEIEPESEVVESKPHHTADY
jgi:hypothetical protein